MPGCRVHGAGFHLDGGEKPGGVQGVAVGFHMLGVVGLALFPGDHAGEVAFLDRGQAGKRGRAKGRLGAGGDGPDHGHGVVGEVGRHLPVVHLDVGVSLGAQEFGDFRFGVEDGLGGEGRGHGQPEAFGRGQGRGVAAVGGFEDHRAQVELRPGIDGVGEDRRAGGAVQGDGDGSGEAAARLEHLGEGGLVLLGPAFQEQGRVRRRVAQGLGLGDLMQQVEKFGIEMAFVAHDIGQSGRDLGLLHAGGRPGRDSQTGGKGQEQHKSGQTP